MVKLLILFILFIPSAHSFYNDFNLKGSVGMNYQSISGDNNTSDNMVGLTLSTQFGYRWNMFELAIASYVTFGKVQNLHFVIENVFEATASGMVRTLNFLPLLRYYTPWIPIPNRNLYFSGGPNFSMRTLWPSDYTVTTGELGEGYKITYIDTGLLMAVGIEEVSAFKEENPSFFEIMLGYSKSKRITVVDASNNKKVKVVHDDKAGPNIMTFILMLNLGITFF